MSAKQQLLEAVSALPENSSLREAFDRLYAAFKEKLQRESSAAATTARRAQWEAIFGAGGTSDAEEVHNLLGDLVDPGLERATR